MREVTIAAIQMSCSRDVKAVSYTHLIILSPALQVDKIMACTAEVVPPTIRKAFAAPKASAASSSASLIDVYKRQFLLLFSTPQIV